MGTFHVEIATSNDAFQDDTAEVARLLRVTANWLIDNYRTSGPLIDINGNQVGTFWFEEDE